MSLVGLVVLGGGPALARPHRLTVGHANLNCAVENGSVLCWDLTPDAARRLSATKLKGIRNAIGVDSGFERACAWNQAGEVFVFGTDLIPKRQAGIPSVRVVALGHQHACAIAKDGRTFCWGRNTHGQMGTLHQKGLSTVVKVPPLVDLVAGAHASCGRTSKGDLYCWGNGHGLSAEAIGDDEEKIARPHQVAPGTRFLDLAADGGLTCAVTLDGAVMCWSQDDELAAYGVSDVPTRVPGFSGVNQIAAGERHFCVVTAAHTVTCWGSNEGDQVGAGLPPSEPFAVPPAMFTLPPFAHTIVELAAGGFGTCVDVDGAEPLCWGGLLDLKEGAQRRAMSGPQTIRRAAE